jgi:predicted CXXCH cytochrome family protein
MKVPDNLPLVDGRLACTTCHDSSSSDRHLQARQEHDGLLRGASGGAGGAGGPAGQQFCAQCHPTTGQDRAAAHAMTIGQAHLRWPDHAPRTAALAKLGGKPGDSDTHLCLSCHDGTLASNVGGLFDSHGDTLHGSHPVDVTYREHPIRKGKLDLAVSFFPAQTLDPRIRLIDDQVACASCHSPYAQEPGHLIMSNQRSKLCLSCHDDLR